jgi:hypothetical protein
MKWLAVGLAFCLGLLLGCTKGKELPQPSRTLALNTGLVTGLTDDTTLYVDSFSGSTAPGWYGQVGTWAVVQDSGNGVYKNGNATGDNWAVYGPSAWQNYAVEAQTKLLSATSGGFARIFCRWQNASNWYYLTLRSTNVVQLRRYLNGAITDLAPQKSYPVALGAWYTLRLECVGSSLKAYVNGVLLLSATDTLFKTGPIAVGGWNAIEAFDNVRVVALGASPPPPPPPPPPSPAGIASITVSPTSIGTALSGFVLRLVATVMDSAGKVVLNPSVRWASSDTTVATVDSTGALRTLRSGTATMTASIKTFSASAILTVTPPVPPPFGGVYADVQLANGHLLVLRFQDTSRVTHVQVQARDTLPDSTGTFGGAAFEVRPSMAPSYAVALRQLAADLPNVLDTVRLQVSNPLATVNLRCVPAGCWLVVVSAHGIWTSRPAVGSAVVAGLAHALESAARGDTVFTPADSLPYVRVLP